MCNIFALAHAGTLKVLFDKYMRLVYNRRECIHCTRVGFERVTLTFTYTVTKK